MPGNDTQKCISFKQSRHLLELKLFCGQKVDKTMILTKNVTGGDVSPSVPRFHRPMIRGTGMRDFSYSIKAICDL